MKHFTSFIPIVIISVLVLLPQSAIADEPNLKTGWAVGDNGLILATQDGGNTWRKQNSGVDVNLKSVWFIDRNNGFAVGDEGSILRTTNAGRKWKAGKYPVKSQHRIIQFIDPQVGFILTDAAHILKTTDGGMSWAPIALPGASSVFGMSFADGEVGLVVADGNNDLALPLVLRTDDSAATWREIDDIFPDLARFQKKQVKGLSLLTVSHGDTSSAWSVGYNLNDANRPNGSIYTSVDGGITWKLQWKHKVSWLYTTSFVNNRVGWAAGYAGSLARPLVLTTSDGGENWKPRTPPGKDIVTGSCLVDELHGWVVGTDGYIAATDDFGATWTQQESGVQQRIFAVHFPQITISPTE